MSRRAIQSVVLALQALRLPTWTLLPAHSIPAAKPHLLSSVSSPLHRHCITAFHSTTVKPFTEDQKARLRAFEEAKEAILKYWRAKHDPDEVIKSLAAVREAHWPTFDAEIRDHLAIFHDTLKVISRVLRDRRVLKDDAPLGMVVYRTSYRDGNDALWERMLKEIWRGFIETLDLYGRLDLLPRHQMVVIDDREVFGNATLDDVREYFQRWAIEEIKRNWRDPPMTEEEVTKIEASKTDLAVGKDCWQGARHTFFLVVDDICLESLDEMSSPVVKLVTKRWGPGGYDAEELEEMKSDGEEQYPGPNPGWEDGFTKDELEYVGWMYRHVSEYVEIHCRTSGRAQTIG